MAKRKKKKVIEEQTVVIETEEKPGVDPCHCYHCGADHKLTLVAVREGETKSIVGFMYLCEADTVMHFTGKLGLNL